MPVAKGEWYQSDVRNALQMASNGDLTKIGQLYRAFARDGEIQGLLSTRSGGLIRLPKKFAGTPRAVAALQPQGGNPGLFAKVFPSSTLEAVNDDGIVCGAGVAEFVEGERDNIPTLVRLDPEFLLYRWSEDRWYYRSLKGLIPVTPGDGRWVLHLPKGRYEPWNRGAWQALGRSYVSKEHALFYRENYGSKLANPARIAISPAGATEPQRQSFFRQLLGWGLNTAIGLIPGWDVKLLESNGRGYEVFGATIETSNVEIRITLAGQIVTVTGGSGFANAGIHASIRSDIIQTDGDGLSETLNTQALPAVVSDLVGPDEMATMSWDTRPPADRKSEAEAMSATAKAVQELAAELAKHGLKLNVAELLERAKVPVLGDLNGDAKPDVPVGAPTPELEEAA
jgi:hypothetical protein